MYWYSPLWKTKEQPLALTDQLWQGTIWQRELFTLVEEVQHCVLYNSCWVHTCFVIYCAIVIFLFTTLHSGRELIMQFVQLDRGRSLHRRRKQYEMTFRSVQLVLGACLLCYHLSVTPFWPFLSPLGVQVGNSSCALCNLPKGAPYVGAGSAARQYSILYNSR